MRAYAIRFVLIEAVGFMVILESCGKVTRLANVYNGVAVSALAVRMALRDCVNCANSVELLIHRPDIEAVRLARFSFERQCTYFCQGNLLSIMCRLYQSFPPLSTRGL